MTDRVADEREPAQDDEGAHHRAHDADEDGRDQRDFMRKPALVSALTREQLRDAARLYLRKDQYARFTLLPEAKPKK